MEMRRTLMSSPGLLLCAAAALATVSADAETPALKSVAPKGLRIGAAVNRTQASGNDAKAVAIVSRQFDTVTAENDLKWERVHPEPDRFDFEPADRYVEFGAKHGMFVVGHVLLWHQQTPAWVFAGENGRPLDRATALARLKGHVDAVVGRYRGRIGGWDVVNEALDEDGSLRKTPWLEAIGEDYIAKAFEFARAADPEAELYYNDYNLWKPAKRDAAVRLVQGLKAKGLRVDGIGEQAHWGIDDPPLEAIDAALAAIRASGATPLITELDMDVLPRDPDMWGADLAKKAKIRAATNVYPDGLPAAVQQQLARRYADVFTLFLEHGVGRVTFWGVTDATSWLHDFPIPGRVNYPLLWDRDGREKPAFEAVVEVLRKHAASLSGLELAADKTDIERFRIPLNEAFEPSRLDHTATVDASDTAHVFITPRVTPEEVAGLKIDGDHGDDVVSGPWPAQQEATPLHQYYRSTSLTPAGDRPLRRIAARI